MLGGMEIDTALRTVHDRLATISQLIRLAGTSAEELSPEMLAGLADIVDEVQDLIAQTRAALPTTALLVEVRGRRSL